MALNAVAMVSMNIINARLLNHIDPTRKLIAGGMMLGVVAVYLLLVAWLQLSLVFVVVGVVLYVGCLGLTAANAIAGALANAGEMPVWCPESMVYCSSALVHRPVP